MYPFHLLQNMVDALLFVGVVSFEPAQGFQHLADLKTDRPFNNIVGSFLLVLKGTCDY